MATSAKWRVVSLLPAREDVELTALELCDESGRVDIGAVITSSHSPLMGSVSALGDGDGASRVRFALADVRSAGFYILWTLPAPARVLYARFGGGAADAWLDCARVEYWDGSRWIAQEETARQAYSGDGVVVPLSPTDAQYANVLACLMPTSSSSMGDTGPLNQTVVGNVGITVVDDAVHTDSWLDLSGTTNTRARIIATPSIVIGTSNFCVDGHVNASAADTKCLFDCRDTSSGFAIYLSTSGNGYFEYWSTQYEYKRPSSFFPVSTDFHWAVERIDGVVNIYIGGASILTFTDARSHSCANGYRFFTDDYWPGWVGRTSGIRVTKAARYAGNFTPPKGLRNYMAPNYLPLRVLSVLKRARTSASACVGNLQTCMVTSTMARDTEFGGNARLYGTTEVEVTEGHFVPKRARLRVLRERDGLLAREVWSDPITGAWSVDGLDPAQSFIALAQDSDGNYRAVAADRATPGAA